MARVATKPIQEPTTTEPEVSETPETSKEEEANGIVKKYMYLSMAAGIAPVVVDSLAITGLQLKMLHSLTKVYDVPFTQNAGKSVIASLVGGIGMGSTSRGAVCSLLKMVPVVGPIAGTATLPAMAGASAYAIGKLFIQHFESGGTFLDFDSASMHEHFRALYAEGKKVASNIDKTVDSAKS